MVNSGGIEKTPPEARFDDLARDRHAARPVLDLQAMDHGRATSAFQPEDQAGRNGSALGCIQVDITDGFTFPNCFPDPLADEAE